MNVFLDKGRPRLSAWLMETDRFGQTSGGQEALTASARVGIGVWPQDWEIRLAQPTRYALALVQRLSSLGYVGIAITGLVVLVAAFLLARGISQPLVQLTAHARDVAQGSLRQYKPKRLRRDEAGELTAAFNEMTAQLARLLHRVRSASKPWPPPARRSAPAWRKWRQAPKPKAKMCKAAPGRSRR